MPSAFFTLTSISSFSFEIFCLDLETINNSCASTSFKISNSVFGKSISISASRLDPIILLDLFSSIAILTLRNESRFSTAYAKGVNKKEYWNSTFEDALDLIAKLPRIAAYIYRRNYHNDNHIEPLSGLDWSANFAHMLGFSNSEFTDLIRLYMTIHSDHEGGNVSAHASHLVGSALSDAYLSFSAGMNGLAGPLHGLANQEVVKWLLQMIEDHNGSIPTKDEVSNYVKKTLSEGRVIPGFGHAVLRKTDPRYMAQRNFALKHLKDYF